MNMVCDNITLMFHSVSFLKKTIRPFYSVPFHDEVRQNGCGTKRFKGIFIGAVQRLGVNS